jgi:hypothetical protein
MSVRIKIGIRWNACDEQQTWSIEHDLFCDGNERTVVCSALGRGRPFKRDGRWCGLRTRQRVSGVRVA